MPTHGRSRYFAAFALRNLSALRPHFHIGETLGKGEGVWRNVAEHCLVSGALAGMLAELLQLPPEQIRAVTHAALLHDWYKKHETLARRPAHSVAEVRRILALKRAEDQAHLRRYGFSEEVLRLTGANIPETTAGPQTIAEKIVWYLDATISDTEPVPVEQRFDALENHPTRGAANRAYSESHKDRLGMPLYELQRRLGRQIGPELAAALGFGGKPEELPFHLRRLLEERWAAPAPS